MADGYSRSPWLLKGALVELTAPLLIPIPNIILFQYNPESVARRLTPWRPTAEAREDDGTTLERNARIQPYDPEERIDLTLILDATDALEKPDFHPVAAYTGVADRLAALEKLVWPIGQGDGLLSVQMDVSLGGASGSLTNRELAQIEQRMSPVTLFVWGPGRIVPVRIESFQVVEKSFNPLLYPVRAEVSLAMRVLTEADFDRDESLPADLARFAYKFTRTQQDVLALANLANTVESVIGMLPL
jgi:hypothetical protein